MIRRLRERKTVFMMLTAGLTLALAGVAHQLRPPSEAKAVIATDDAGLSKLVPEMASALASTVPSERDVASWFADKATDLDRTAIIEPSEVAITVRDTDLSRAVIHARELADDLIAFLDGHRQAQKRGIEDWFDDQLTALDRSLPARVTEVEKRLFQRFESALLEAGGELGEPDLEDAGQSAWLDGGFTGGDYHLPATPDWISYRDKKVLADDGDRALATDLDRLRHMSPASTQNQRNYEARRLDLVERRAALAQDETWLEPGARLSAITTPVEPPVWFGLPYLIPGSLFVSVVLGAVLILLFDALSAVARGRDEEMDESLVFCDPHWPR